MGLYTSESSPYLVALGLLTAMLCGFLYGFGVYSENLKQTFHLPQSEISSLGSAMSVMGQYSMNIIAGPIVATAPLKWAYFASFLLTAPGYLILFLTTSEVISYNYHIMWCAFYAIGGGGAIFLLAAVPTMVTHLQPERKSFAVGIIMCVFGMSTVVLQQVFKHLLNSSMSHLFLFMSVSTAATLCACTLFFKKHTPPTQAPAPHSNQALEAAAQSECLLNHRPYTSSSCNSSRVSAVSLVAAPAFPHDDELFAAVLDFQRENFSPRNSTASSDIVAPATPLNPPAAQKLTLKDCQTHFKSPTFWLLLTLGGAAAMHGITTITNATAINKSAILDRDGTSNPDVRQAIDSLNSTAMLLTSVGNTLGRFLMGLLIDATRDSPVQFLTSGFWMLCQVSIVTAIASTYGFFFPTIPSNAFLLSLNGLTGLAHGLLLTGVGTVFSEGFPLVAYPALFGGYYIGPLVLSSLAGGLFGTFSDRLQEIDPLVPVDVEFDVAETFALDVDAGEGVVASPVSFICASQECFRPTYRVIALCGLALGIPAGIALTVRGLKQRRARDATQ